MKKTIDNETVANKSYLLWQLTKREVLNRYKNSYLGILWSILIPIVMLTIYTFVFSVIFQARWGIENSNKLEFAVILFCGLNVYTIFSDCISRAPFIIANNVNLVKKVLFPLELLQCSVVFSALFHFLIGTIVLLFGSYLLLGKLYWTFLLLPIYVLPMLMISLGVGWFLSSLAVYVKDVGNIVGIIITALMFLTPIFYPTSAIPSEFQLFYLFNPFTNIVENCRSVAIYGIIPDTKLFLLYLGVSILIMIVGYKWFMKTKEGFADVL